LAQKNISLQDFLMATDPATFFIRITLPENFQPQEVISLDNDKTKERLVIKMEKAYLEEWEILISRYPQESTKKWIVENEIEVLNWEFSATKNGRTIYLSQELKVVAI
jgi:hypothetical protein